MSAASLSLGPLLFLWNGPKWRDFYFRIADEAPISHVTVGEIVCSKRFHFMAPYMDAVIERLQRAGKEVSLGSLALVMLEREAKQIRQMIEKATLPVEANDLSALGLLSGVPHSVGPLVNVYNAATAKVLSARGAHSICLPPELPVSSIHEIVKGAPGIAFEVFTFGRVPLAISARCAHARSKGHIKDNCQFVCGEEPDGLPVRTLDSQPFLALNGVQTLSHTCQSLIEDMPDLLQAGVRRFRLSPQDCDMVAVAGVHKEVLDNKIGPEEGAARLRELYPNVPLSNGFLHGNIGAAWISRQRSATAH
ncbi:collagenase-like PrtC family protease [Ochrobactrum daejeonense]|uniref:Ubiquinone biosynthesis protein UbiV n=1 Tax=Brucella daejeonensis TaxID=659015 RepID=A0A7W9B0A9_9HYPH|nr:U32 family peptidase [Brucella daejeonensis]MBB5703883.1 collagenase-like PrtC family protease [Brucella daejeonensis]